ncbi:unnamed protein product [Leuciscus chuanchicus]
MARFGLPRKRLHRVMRLLKALMSIWESFCFEENQSYALLRITITDANEPKFEESHYDGELPKNSPGGRSVLQSKASDSDMGPNGEQALPVVQVLLSINHNTGTIFVKGSVDHVEISILKFYVQAKHNGPQLESSKVLVSEIQGINLVKHEDGVAKISENMLVVTAVALVDVSDCTLLDYERIKDYRIGIVAVDSGNPVLSSTNSLKVQVTYMNDNSPVFSSTLYVIDFAEENQPA